MRKVLIEALLILIKSTHLSCRAGYSERSVSILVAVLGELKVPAHSIE